MNTLYVDGVRFIQWLQSFQTWEGLLVPISDWGRPMMAYIFVFPAAFYLDPVLGITTLLCTTFSEWLSGILKWLLYGHRPYWWVMLYAQETNSQIMNVKQFPSTCETGPGSPSGHCMITLSSLVPILIYLYIRSPKVYRESLLVMFMIFVVLLGLSRCYLAAHFPHQVVAGIFSGIFLGYLFSSITSQTVGMSPNQSSNWLNRQITLLLNRPIIITWLGLGSLAVAFMCSRFLQSVCGIDPNWSHKLAVRACKHKEWIHMSTTLMVGFARIAGYLAGLSIAMDMRTLPLKRPVLGTTSPLAIIPTSILTCIGTQFIESLIHFLLDSVISSTFVTSSNHGPNLLHLMCSIIEAMTGPILTVYFIPTCFDFLLKNPG